MDILGPARHLFHALPPIPIVEFYCRLLEGLQLCGGGVQEIVDMREIVDILEGFSKKNRVFFSRIVEHLVYSCVCVCEGGGGLIKVFKNVAKFRVPADEGLQGGSLLSEKDNRRITGNIKEK